MGTVLELGRHVLEGIEVLCALATTAVLGAELIRGRFAGSAEPPLNAEAPRED